jgi:predicted nucleic acid-binding protein
VDTNIFLDFLLERKNLQGKDISAPAQKLFCRAMQCEFFLVYSDHTATELNKVCSGEHIRMMFGFLKKKIVTITKSPEDALEAQKLGPTNFSDALHAVLAKKSGADYVITRNTKDFEEFSSYIKPRAPENI